MPRVLYFSSETHVQGGAVQLMFRTARWLKEQGGEPVVVLPQGGAIVEWYETAGVDVKVIPFVKMHRSRSVVYLVRYLFSTMSIVAKLVGLIRRKGVEIVHVNEITYFPGLLAGKIGRAKTICHARAIITRPAWARRGLSWIVRHLSDRVLCESEAVKKWMFPGAHRNVQTLYPPGPDMERFDPHLIEDPQAIRRRLGIPLESFVVGLVSKFTAPKGHLALVEAARLIQERRPDMNITYLLVGGKVTGHEGYYARVRESIERFDLEKSFVLTGPRQDVPQLMAACDVVVHLPQHEDPCPGVVMEAMAMQRPIVAFASGGVPEQFEDGKSGILLEKDDVQSLAEALIALSQDKELAEKLGRNARQFLPSRFSHEKFFSELSAIYTKLIEPSST